MHISITYGQDNSVMKIWVGWVSGEDQWGKNGQTLLTLSIIKIYIFKKLVFFLSIEAEFF